VWGADVWVRRESVWESFRWIVWGEVHCSLGGGVCSGNRETVPPRAGGVGSVFREENAFSPSGGVGC
jgi:hypothetical protein